MSAQTLEPRIGASLFLCQIDSSTVAETEVKPRCTFTECAVLGTWICWEQRQGKRRNGSGLDETLINITYPLSWNSRKDIYKRIYMHSFIEFQVRVAAQSFSCRFNWNPDQWSPRSHSLLPSRSHWQQALSRCHCSVHAFQITEENSYFLGLSLSYNL